MNVKPNTQDAKPVDDNRSHHVRPQDLPKLALLGADRISMGRLTHSAPAFDCSLDILRVQNR